MPEGGSALSGILEKEKVKRERALLMQSPYRSRTTKLKTQNTKMKAQVQKEKNKTPLRTTGSQEQKEKEESSGLNERELHKQIK